MSDKYRNVSDNFQALIVCVILDGKPLTEEEELVKLFCPYFGTQLVDGVLKGLLFANLKRLRPFEPGLLSMRPLDRSVGCIVVQPPSVVLAKSLELSSEIIAA